MERKIIEGYWKIIYKTGQTNHISYSSTLVKATTRVKALAFFNKYIADNEFIFQVAKTTSVYPVKFYDSNPK